VARLRVTCGSRTSTVNDCNEMEHAVSLTGERCVACHVDSPRVTPDEEASLLAEIPDWTLLDIDGVHRLERTFRIPGWRDPLAFTVAVGELADEEDHHPLIVTDWGKVTITWWTRAIRGLHRNDFIMAAKTDELFAATR